MDNTKKNDRRISIVINGQEKRYEELEKDKHLYEEALNQEISATSDEEQKEEFNWLLSENQRKEPSPKIVDLGERRRDKKKLVGPYWDDGKSDSSPKIPLIKRKKKAKFDFDIKRLPLGLLGVIAAAIIVGTSFGFMMLTIFTGEKPEPSVLPSQVQTPATVEVPVSTATIGQVPTLGVEVVQGGAFSLVAKGNETAQQLKERGFASVLTNTTEPVYLFIGLGLDREQATIVADHYRANGQEVYLKPYAVSTSASIEKEEQHQFLQTSIDLFHQLALLSVNGLANGGSLITDEALTQLKTNYNRLQSVGEPFIESEIHHSLALAFQKELENAYQKLENYASSKDPQKLWEVQQSLLNGLITYEQLVKMF